MKQKDLAEKLKVSPSHLSEIESGKKPVTMDLLESYSKIFRIPVSSILYFAEAGDGLGKVSKENPIAPKALKMLEWLEAISNDSRIEDEDEIST